MSEATADEIRDKLNSAADAADKQEASTAREGELIEKKQADEAEADAYKKARMTGEMVMGLIAAGIDFTWPYVEIPDREKFYDDGADRHAKVFQKYNIGGGELPPWLQEVMPEIKLAIWYGGAGFVIWKQIQAHKAAQEAREAAEAQQQQPGGEGGNQSESRTA